MYNTALDTTNVVAGVVVAAGLGVATRGPVVPKRGFAAFGVARRTR